MAKRKLKSSAGTNEPPRKRAKNTKEVEKPSETSYYAEPANGTYNYPKPTTWEGSYTYNYWTTFGPGPGPKKYIVAHRITLSGTAASTMGQKRKAKTKGCSADGPSQKRIKKDQKQGEAVPQVQMNEPTYHTKTATSARACSTLESPQGLNDVHDNNSNYIYPEPTTWEGAYSYDYCSELKKYFKSGASINVTSPDTVTSVEEPDGKDAVNSKEEDKNPIGSTSTYTFASADIKAMSQQGNFVWLDPQLL
ncbi:hypothetical protein HDK90DRAFT_510514 [Phyllosticta capitalensis]|uniref:Uncharacterized protein n=1 Tax=Phyllosticta capitalensis TaxID=121624 RepID=A0ABR1YPW7_9PEZI